MLTDDDDDDDVYYYIRWRLELEGETENTGVCTKERKGVAAAFTVSLLSLPHKNGVGPLEWTSGLIDLQCFIGSCKAHCRSIRMVSFSKERVP